MKKEEDFDDIFKKGLGRGDEPAYQEDDWNALAQMLDAPKTKLGLTFWIPVLSSAAVLLIAFGWWVLRPENAHTAATKIQAQAIAKQEGVKGDEDKTVPSQRKDMGSADRKDSSLRQNTTEAIAAGKKNMGSGDRKDSSDNQNTVKATYAASARQKDVASGDRQDSGNNQSGVVYAKSARRKDLGSADRNESDPEEKIAKHIHNNVNHRSKLKVIAPDVLAANQNNTLEGARKANRGKHNVNPDTQKGELENDAANGSATNSVVNSTRDNEALIAYNQGLTIGQYNVVSDINAFAVQPTAIEAKRSLLPIKRNKPVVKSNSFHPQYALSVIGAPEINGVNSLSQTSKGTNLGLLFSVELFNKVFVSTGAMYSIKPYNSNVSNYAYNASYASRDITSIYAHCRVLDVPLNLDYQFYNKHLNRLSVGTGLSSYIMLYEHYQYNYTNPDINAPYNKTIPQTNKYILGVLNLQATYSRQVSPNVSLSLQPYMKLPLTGIGATSANLQTAGFAIGLNWNINSIFKQ